MVFLEGVARRQVHAHGEALGVVAHLVVVERHRGRRAEVLLLEEGASRGDRSHVGGVLRIEALGVLVAQ